MLPMLFSGCERRPRRPGGRKPGQHADGAWVTDAQSRDPDRHRLDLHVQQYRRLAQVQPRAMRLIGEGITANGAALVVGGAGAIPAAIGPVGWFVLRIGGLATAFAAASSFDGTM